MLSAPVSFAEWNPTPLEITVQEHIFYLFDGTEVEIPVSVSGRPCRAYLWINTRLADADKPVNLTNGYLGWHYVNGIDTTVYISRAYDFPICDNRHIIWDGTGSENTSKEYMGTNEPSEKVRRGSYDYYVFGYDDTNPRERVCDYIPISFYWNPQYTRIGEWHDDGTPRANPYLWGNVPNMYDRLHGVKSAFGNYVTGPEEGWDSWGPPTWTAFKFPIGSDPNDMDALETTFMPGFSVDEFDVSPIVFDPNDEEIFYALHDNLSQNQSAMFKWKWVSGGEAFYRDDWGGYDDLPLETAPGPGMDEKRSAVSTDGEYIYMVSPGNNSETKRDKFYVISFDGEEVSRRNRLMLDPFHSPGSSNPNGAVNRMFAAIDRPGQAVMGGEQHCLTMMVNTTRIADGDDSYIKWMNGNGDFFLDNNWDPDQIDPAALWECNTGDGNSPNGPIRNEPWFDRNGVTVQHADFLGIMSFVVYTQDGSGVAYCRFGDETVSMAAVPDSRTSSSQRCDNGSLYDGIYLGEFVTYQTGYGPGKQSVNWIASDSAHGVIDGCCVDFFTHSVSAPLKPEGPTNCKENVRYSYNILDRNCWYGHNAEYLYTWNDEEPLPWTTSASCFRRFETPGTHTLKVMSRCSEDNTLVSRYSETLEVFVDSYYTPKVSNTGNSMTMLITRDNIPLVNSNPIKFGDVIGVFTPRGTCAGDGVWEGEDLLITVWGDDPNGQGISGFQENEPLTIRLWDSSISEDYTAEATFTFGNDTFRSGTTAEIESLAADYICSRVESDAPAEFTLSQNAPNPFNPSTTIEYVIPGGETAAASLKIYDMRGTLVRTLLNETSNPGMHSIVWDGADDSGNAVSSGIYIYTLTAGTFRQSQKMTLVR